MATFADRLKQLRTEAGYSQHELAIKVGISYGAVGNYESGVRKPRYETLEALADLFNVEIDYLLGKTNERPEFTLEETWIINCYRHADLDTREAVRIMLRKYDQKSTASRVG